MARGSREKMTLEDALAVHLYYLEDGDTIGEREERVLDMACEMIDRAPAKRAIASSESGSAQETDSLPRRRPCATT